MKKSVSYQSRYKKRKEKLAKELVEFVNGGLTVKLLQLLTSLSRHGEIKIEWAKDSVGLFGRK